MQAFKKHAHSYDNWNSGSDYSQRLILCYCVECGLKCLIMKNEKIFTIAQANEEIVNVLGTHDFQKLLKQVNQVGTYKFSNFSTEYDQMVSPSDYHQVCRYCVNPKDGKIEYLTKFDNTLNDIKEWLKEVI